MSAGICKVKEERDNCKGIVSGEAKFGAESRWCKGRSVSAHRYSCP